MTILFLLIWVSVAASIFHLEADLHSSPGSLPGHLVWFWLSPLLLPLLLMFRLVLHLLRWLDHRSG